MTFGDRTAEFAAVAASLRQRPDVRVQPRHRNNALSTKLSLSKAASEIGRETHETTQKLKELTKLAKSRSLFDDPAEKIEELTAIVKQDIQSIKTKIAALQSVASSQRHDNQQSHTHSDTIIDSLNDHLMNTTKQFQKVLEIRTENLKTQQERKEKYIGSRRATSPAMYQPYVPVLDEDDEGDENGGADELSIHLPLVQTREQFLEQRSHSIRTVEQTINEIKSIFQEISHLTVQQDEMLQHIDDDIESVSRNVSGAYGELLKYIPKVTANRWLYLKIFGILVVFMVLFIVFFV